MPETLILVVDDEPVMTNIISSTLSRFDYHVITAENGKDALQKMTGVSPDLVLLDINMPVMDGFETLERIKSNEATARIPVVMLTGIGADRETMMRCLNLGADDFLTKPFDEHGLLIRIRNHTRLKMLCDVEIEKERIMGALEMAQAASKDMKELLDQIVETAELIVYDRPDDLPREKYFKQFKEDINDFINLTEKLSNLDF
ncbi:MAG: response regulator [Deltaproteobacteria bacterium]|nr:response regulator [Deltaproteobacteria bacterium]